MSIGPDDLDLKKIFGVQLFLLANAGWVARARLTLRALVSVLGRRPEPPPSGHGILFFNSHARDDYVILFRKAFEACRHPKIYWQLRLTWGPNIHAFALFFAELPRWRTVTAEAGHDFLARLLLYIFWIRCRQIGALAERLPYTALAVVCDVQLVESYLVQVTNWRNLSTMTLQHGLYIDDGSALSSDNLNPVNYLNSTAHYFLAWGAQTKALVEKYCRCTCIVVGNPVIAKANRTIGIEYFYVLTDADQRFRVYNERLLEIAVEYSKRKGMRYFVQFHPDNDWKSYGIHPRGNKEFPLVQATFAIGHMTSQIFRAMRQGVPVYRLASSLMNHPISKELLFSDVEQLLTKAVSPEIFVKVSRDYISDLDLDAMERYTMAFDLILSDPARNRVP